MTKKAFAVYDTISKERIGTVYARDMEHAIKLGKMLFKDAGLHPDRAFVCLI